MEGEQPLLPGAVSPPKELPAYPAAKRARPKTPRPGGGLRARWKDDDGCIYEWDYQHGTVERYDSRGRHIGEFDHRTGAQLKPASSRRMEP